MASLPIIDLSKAHNPETKPQFLEDLKNALFRIGFYYLINHGAEKEADAVLNLAPKLFDAPTEEKLKIGMVNNPHFVGYTHLGAEKTQKKLDLREQYDFGSADSTDYNPGDPEWKKLHGPSQFLPDNVVAGNKKVITDYINACDRVSSEVIELTAESLGLEKDIFQQYKGKMNRIKVVKYPSPDLKGNLGEEFRTQQGVGPHKDSSGMFTFVLQDSVGGLQVLNTNGEWLDAVPIPGSFVVNVAQGFEVLTGGRCAATTHRVISPPQGITRYSVPFFQGIKLTLTRDDLKYAWDQIGNSITDGPNDSRRRMVAPPSEFMSPKYACLGEAHLRNRIISHRDASERWYPDLLHKYVAELG